jgi:hypothetical protein
MTVEPGVNYPEIARSTDEFNGAQLKAVCVEAGMIALREGASRLSHEHFLSGIAEGARVARARGLGALTACASASEEEERPHVLRVIQAFPAASLGCPCSIRTYRTLGALFCTTNQGFEFFWLSCFALATPSATLKGRRADPRTNPAWLPPCSLFAASTRSWTILMLNIYEARSPPVSLIVRELWLILGSHSPYPVFVPSCASRRITSLLLQPGCAYSRRHRQMNGPTLPIFLRSPVMSHTGFLCCASRNGRKLAGSADASRRRSLVMAHRPQAALQSKILLRPLWDTRRTRRRPNIMSECVRGY